MIEKVKKLIKKISSSMPERAIIALSIIGMTAISCFFAILVIFIFHMYMKPEFLIMLASQMWGCF